MPLSRRRAVAAAGLFALAALAPGAYAPVAARAAAEAAPTAYWVYFGTYTGNKDGDSKGIYRAKMDIKTGKLSAAELAFEMGSPSFLAVHPNGRFLYAVGEGGGKEGGPVVAFGLDQKTGKLTKLNEALSGGSGPCHVAVDPTGMFAGVANYGGGSSAFFKIGADGKIGERVTFTQHAGSGPNKGRQEAPHAHCVQFVPGTKYVVGLVADLGLDQVKVFAQSVTKADVVESGAFDIALPPGAGPRHIAVAGDGKYAYVCGELDSTVNVVRLGFAKTDKSEVVQSLSTLPNPVKGNSTAECVLHPSGKYVYVSNRGHNSVAVFKVNDDRKLTAAGHVTGDIKTPRNFAVDPTGKWMLVASQDGGKVGVWEIDATTGAGKETGSTTAVSRPVCVKFVPVAE
ncbi:MAG TPA: lactonase family protein [Urbifossiella sp.]|nr:lactonase family protein [Urbifossiella sp.]